MVWICSFGVPNCPECRRPAATLDEKSDDRMYLRIPYADKEEAKSLGCLWDPERRLWYAFNRNIQLSTILSRWRPAAGGPDTRRPPARAAKPLSGRPAQPDLGSILTKETKEPVPGVATFDELMEAIRAADRASAEPQKITVPAAPKTKGV